MGKVIPINPCVKTKLPKSDSKKPVQKSEVDYLNSLQSLADEAKRLSGIYGLGAKDVLTDALCLLIESAILDECTKYDPDPAI